MSLGPPHGKKRMGDDFHHNKVGGTTWKELKHHYAIIPIIGMTVFALGMAGAYVLRLATRHPEVSWSNRNAEPWNEYTNKQYKFANYTDRDYSRSTEAPTFSKK